MCVCVMCHVCLYVCVSEHVYVVFVVMVVIVVSDDSGGEVVVLVLVERFCWLVVIGDFGELCVSHCVWE